MKFKLVIICCVFDLIYFVESSKLSHVSHEYSTFSKAVSNFISHAYLNDTPTVNICASPMNDNQKLVMDEIINEIIMQSGEVFQIEQYSYLNASNQKRFHNVILISNYASFRQIYKCLLAENFAYQGYFLFVMIEGFYNSKMPELKQIVADLFDIFVVNVNILIKMPSENELVMLTYHPFHPLYCGEAYPLFINVFKDSEFLILGTFFVDLLKNMNQCPLRVATHNVPPFMMTHSLENNTSLYGSDASLLIGNYFKTFIF